MNSDKIEVYQRPIKRRRLSIDEDDADAKIDLHSNGDQITMKDKDDQEAKDWEVGIQSCVNTRPTRLSGTLKQRYTDFLVNEILLDGTVLHLQNTKAPKQKPNRPDEIPVRPEVTDSVQPTSPQHKCQDDKQVQASGSGEADSGDISDSDREQLITYLNETAANELIELYKSIRTYPNKKSRDHPAIRTDFTSDRTLRGKIHQFIRQVFHSRIESSTDHDGILVLTAANKAQRGGQQNDSRTTHRMGKLSWADRGGEYLHFTLYKENKDTMEAISYLARQLKCNAKSFQFAGTKDRRAVTTQRCSAYRIEAERLAAQNGSFRNSKVGDFTYQSRGLDLGDLKGNEFVITLRDASISGPDGGQIILDDIKDRVSSLHTNGFINYYGHQRFGTFSMRTDVIGGHILREDFQAACDAILHYSEETLPSSSDTNSDNNSNNRTNQDDLARAQAIQLWRSTNNANKALDIMPRKFSGESQLIRHLSRHPNDFYGALMLIQRNLRLMYVHAYQSYIWNFAASNRIKLYGSKVVPGDLILVNEHKDKELQTETSTNTQNGNKNISSTTDADGDPILEPDSTDRAKNPDDIFERARALTAADIEAHNYTIFDLVLPQPGFDILYPDNESGKFYETFMKSEAGGNLNPYDMRRKHRDFSLAGAYRKIVGKIGEGWNVNIHRYEKDDEQFVQTDWDVLQAAREKGGVSGGNTNVEGVTNDEGGEGKDGDVKVEDQRKTAIVLKFQLGSSQYATMALRELSGGGVRPYKPEFSSGR